ncbi:BON domain-containing protein [Legionella shakespearei]|uniref:Osmotically inducible protein Y n=1 Tax=Legionella shakespearei DSM 23087 TaxID=1122169 RepID=A0A0W0ZCY0_9GAMM|nr:BON domain-containing protein [Legionella shakespearei]KTD66670.1 osmotically inducible protein Y [Legionella shakespearei DSM 23087]
MRKFFYHTLALTLALLINPLHANNLKQISREISDSVITAKITAQFTESKNLNPLKVSVTTEQGIVTLSGYVGDREAYVDALRIAKHTKGVTAVSANELHIKKVNTALTDAFITAQVETAVLKAKVLDDESIPLVGINATTTNGVVTLSGSVSSAQALASIIKRVNAIKGVKKIITHLEIKESA